MTAAPEGTPAPEGTSAREATAAERQARRYLALFPVWMRATRGEEAIGLVLDLLPAGTRRLPARSRLDLLRAGLQARRRGTPPAWVWIDVLSAAPTNARGRAPERWHPWLRAFLREPGWSRRQSVACIVPTVLVVLGLHLAGLISNLSAVWFGAIFVGVRRGAGALRWRRAVLVRNGFAEVPAGSGAEPPLTFALRDGPAAPALLRWSAGCAATGAAAAVVAGALDPPPSLRSVLGAAAVALVVVGGLLRFGRRALAAVPAEPVRWVVHDRRRDNWALRALVLGAAVLLVASGLPGAIAGAGMAAGGLVLRRSALVRGRAVGRPVRLWEVVPIAGPGAMLTPPPAVTAVLDGPDGPASGSAAGRTPF